VNVVLSEKVRFHTGHELYMAKQYCQWISVKNPGIKMPPLEVCCPRHLLALLVPRAGPVYVDLPSYNDLFYKSLCCANHFRKRMILMHIWWQKLCLYTSLSCVQWPKVVSLVSNYAIGWKAWNWNFGRARYFSLLQKHPDQLWGPPSLLFNGYEDSLPEVKQPRHEVYHSAPSSANVWMS
jgi:hypothetical protein